ncbi:MAG: hypothetical protein IAG13_27680 [Deltaproteobacteria bacterium]|nr:hypothetical protein [Nannocystaceae bacterium]
MTSRVVRPLAIAVLGLVACRRDAATDSPDPCRDGSCAPAADCTLGDCMTDGVPALVSKHSPQAGTEVEDGASCPFVDGELPPRAEIADDSNIPEFKRGRSRRQNNDTGSGKPQDIELHEQLMGMQGRIFECIDLAACYSSDIDPFVAGEIEFQFELEPTGKVSAVSVKPSPSLSDPIVRACARRSLYEHTFSDWDGARMVVSYRVEVGEG